MPRLTEALADVSPGDRVTARAVDGRRIRGAVARTRTEEAPVAVIEGDDATYRLDAGGTGDVPTVFRREGDGWVEYGDLVAIEAVETRNAE